MMMLAGAVALGASGTAAAGQAAQRQFGPSEPVLCGEHAAVTRRRRSTRSKIRDYQPAIEAGMAEQLKEIEAIANNPAAPTFENTLVAMEKSGAAAAPRAGGAFNAVTQANTNPTLEKVQEIEAPKLAAHEDAIFLNAEVVRARRGDLQADGFAGAGCGVAAAGGVYYKQFVHAGANLSAADKVKLKKLNEEESTLSNELSARSCWRRPRTARVRRRRTRLR